MKIRTNFLYRVICLVVSATFLTTVIFPPEIAQAKVLNLPVPGTMLAPTPAYTPAIVKGMSIYPDDPLKFDFIIDSGSDDLQGSLLERENNKIIKYFLASLTIPEEDMWVNLSPYEKDRMIENGFGQTLMGRDLLAQDYILKQLMSSLLYPEKEIGQKFWQTVYAKAHAQFGTTNIPVDSFNKVWIMPDSVTMHEQGNSVFIADAKMKVLLDTDYKQTHDTGHMTQDDQQGTGHGILSTEIMRQVVIPELEREVNEGALFANLRQITHTMILAAWYKMNLKESLLGQIYVDQNKTQGPIEHQQVGINDKIYNQYLEAYKQGVYNFIKEEHDPATNNTVARKYFSGGMVPRWTPFVDPAIKVIDPRAPFMAANAAGSTHNLTFTLKPADVITTNAALTNVSGSNIGNDQAMVSFLKFIGISAILLALTQSNATAQSLLNAASQTNTNNAVMFPILEDEPDVSLPTPKFNFPKLPKISQPDFHIQLKSDNQGYAADSVAEVEKRLKKFKEDLSPEKTDSSKDSAILYLIFLAEDLNQAEIGLGTADPNENAQLKTKRKKLAEWRASIKALFVQVLAYYKSFDDKNPLDESLDTWDVEPAVKTLKLLDEKTTNHLNSLKRFTQAAKEQFGLTQEINEFVATLSQMSVRIKLAKQEAIKMENLIGVSWRNLRYLDEDIVNLSFVARGPNSKASARELERMGKTIEAAKKRVGELEEALKSPRLSKFILGTTQIFVGNRYATISPHVLVGVGAIERVVDISALIKGYEYQTAKYEEIVKSRKDTDQAMAADATLEEAVKEGTLIDFTDSGSNPRTVVVTSADKNSLYFTIPEGWANTYELTKGNKVKVDVYGETYTATVTRFDKEKDTHYLSFKFSDEDVEQISKYFAYIQSGDFNPLKQAERIAKISMWTIAAIAVIPPLLSYLMRDDSELPKELPLQNIQHHTTTNVLTNTNNTITDDDSGDQAMANKGSNTPNRVEIFPILFFTFVVLLLSQSPIVREVVSFVIERGGGYILGSILIIAVVAQILSSASIRFSRKSREDKTKKEKNKAKDSAMKIDDLPVASHMKGGIDLDSAMISWDIKRDDRGVVLPVSQQPLEFLKKVKGLGYQILNQHLINLPLILGISQQVHPESELTLNDLDPYINRREAM